MSDEFYEAFEEWAVMTVDGKGTDLYINKPVYAIHLADVKECK